ncbi:MAG TPA: mechanosensitive ion channel family protein [Blastocatellia bacterium]|nr:mechanosensitive ion channel family protein [Blastocatellia bacterium]
MNFWENAQTASAMSGAYHWVVLGFILAAVLLFVFVTDERARIRGAVLLFALSFVGLLTAGAIISYGGERESFGYRSVRLISLFLESAAIINLAGVFVFGVVLRGLRVRPALIMRDLLVALAYIIVAITLLSRGGVDLAGVVATSAVITAVIGFSLQDTLGNIMGGMALQMERTITVGDWVRIDQQEGRVKEIRWRQTSIETRNWDTIVIPNSILMKGQVTLLGRREGAPRQHRQWVYFNVDFRYAPTEVIQLVETALRAEPIPNVASDPSPHCLVTDFKDSYATYAARYWLTELALTDPTDSLVRSRIYSALRRADIPLSIPAQSVFVTEEDDKRRERKRGEEIERRVGALSKIELFDKLTDEERYELARGLRAAPFVRGEAMTKQGAQAHWLYLIVEGEAEVDIAIDGKSEKVATLRGGDYFGEMSLMTGEPRSATVIATTDVKCYRLDQQAFKDILRHRPELAEDISCTLARRRVELEAVREELNEEVIRSRMRYAQNEFLHRIREFFRLGGDGQTGSG